MTSCPGTNDIWLDGFGFGDVVRVRTNASRAGPRLKGRAAGSKEPCRD